MCTKSFLNRRYRSYTRCVREECMKSTLLPACLLWLQRVCAAAEHFSTNIIYKNKREAAISSQEQDVYDPQSDAAV